MVDEKDDIEGCERGEGLLEETRSRSPIKEGAATSKKKLLTQCMRDKGIEWK